MSPPGEPIVVVGGAFSPLRLKFEACLTATAAAPSAGDGVFGFRAEVW